MIAATCAVLVLLNGIPLPCRPGLIDYYPRVQITVGPMRIVPIAGPWPLLSYPPGRVEIVGMELPVFRGGFE